LLLALPVAAGEKNRHRRRRGAQSSQQGKRCGAAADDRAVAERAGSRAPRGIEAVAIIFWALTIAAIDLIN
jgi:hypothetical protein